MTYEENYRQKKILDYLRGLEKAGYPVHCERRQAGGFSYKRGMADVWCTVHGYHIEIECKDSTGQLKTLQEKWRDLCIKQEMGYILARELKDVKSIVDDLLKL